MVEIRHTDRTSRYGPLDVQDAFSPAEVVRGTILGRVFSSQVRFFFNDLNHPLLDLPYNDTAAPKEPSLLKNVGGIWSELV
jgi:hypothetical protein